MSELPFAAIAVIGLADEVRAHLIRGDFGGRRAVVPGVSGVGDGELDAAAAARVVLADVEHCLELSARGRPREAERWRELAAQLRAIERVAP